MSRFQKYLDALPHVRAIVVGDVMLDSYWFGKAVRISPEAPVPVVTIHHKTEVPGGAANVAMNLKALGCQVDLWGCLGDDEVGHRLQTLLSDHGIYCHWYQPPQAVTVHKLRVVDRHQQLIRLDEECVNQPVIWDDKHFLAYQALLDQTDIVILSDYNKGALFQAQRFITAAKQAGVPVLVDPKRRCFDAYYGSTLIKPNLFEFEQVTERCISQEYLVAQAKALLKTCSLEALLVTQGADGMTLILEDEEFIHWPAHIQDVYDVTGAGDTVMAVLAAMFVVTHDWKLAAQVANQAAGLVVCKFGTDSVSVDELSYALLGQKHRTKGVFMQRPMLLQCVAAARSRGERIVMTNGCFDMLHAGHVSYLMQAKALGDRLLVAVNDDASVRQLKGPRRPIHPLNARIEVLAALNCVDWVVPFSEDTPEALIRQVVPDILVKGADYTKEEVVGKDTVCAAGGKVVLLPFKEGFSTSEMIHKIVNLNN